MVQDGERSTKGQSAVVLLFNQYAEHIMKNARLGEIQTGIKIGGRNINNLRYVDTTLMAESEEKLKRLLIMVKEENERASLKLF